MQTNQQKRTKTYGLAGFDAPFRQGRSLSLPTLPFQQTNRYAVVGARTPTSTWVIMNSLLSRSGVKNELERHRYQAPP